MANPLSNAAGNVAPRWVYQAILDEMTDKNLYVQLNIQVDQM